MKFALIFLTLCFCMLTTSYGQNQFYWPFFYNGQQHHQPIQGELTHRYSGAYWPRSYFTGLFGHSYRNYFSHQEPQLNADDFEQDSLGEEETVGRNKMMFSPKHKFSNKYNQERLAERLLMNGGLSNKYKQPVTIVTTFATTYAATSTVTNTIVVNCIAAAQFAANPPPACRRRRESSSSLLEIDPTPNNEQLETSALVNEDTYSKRDGRDLESSFNTFENPNELSKQVEPSPRLGFLLLGNALFGGNTATTVTSTVLITIPTSYSFTSRTITSNIVLGAAGALRCLPTGYNVC